MPEVDMVEVTVDSVAMEGFTVGTDLGDIVDLVMEEGTVYPAAIDLVGRPF